MKRMVIFGFIAICLLVVAACGGASTSTSSSGAGNANIPYGVMGVYSGTYTTNIITTATPYSASIDQDGFNLGGWFSSLKISGSVSGTVAKDKTMTLNVTEANSLGTVKVILSPVGDGFAISSISGNDVFGAHTGGSGTVVKHNNALSSLIPNGYNGNALFVNTGISTIPNGYYPLSITNIHPDGSGNYSGAVANKFMSGVLALEYLTDLSMYSGVIYTGFGTTPWALNNGGIALTDFANNLVDMHPMDFPASGMSGIFGSYLKLHPGDFVKEFPITTNYHTWNYLNPNQSGTGILSLQMEVTSTDGMNYSAIVAASVRQAADGPVDTVSGTIKGQYDLLPAVNPRAAAGRIFQLALTPSATAPLNLTNNSGSTTGISVYVDWLDISTAIKESVGNIGSTVLVSVDTGKKTWDDITLEKK